MVKRLLDDPPTSTSPWFNRRQRQSPWRRAGGFSLGSSWIDVSFSGFPTVLLWCPTTGPRLKPWLIQGKVPCSISDQELGSRAIGRSNTGHGPTPAPPNKSNVCQCVIWYFDAYEEMDTHSLAHTHTSHPHTHTHLRRHTQEAGRPAAIAETKTLLEHGAGHNNGA